MDDKNDQGGEVALHYAVVEYGKFKTACGLDARTNTISETTRKRWVTCKHCIRALLRANRRNAALIDAVRASGEQKHP